MGRKFLIGILLVVLGIIGCVVVLSSENALVVNPKGIVAESILKLIVTNIGLMLIVILPTYLFLFWVVWKYCIQRKNAKYDPEHEAGPLGELAMWVVPSLVIAVMALVTWESTHRLNPYKPLESNVKPLFVQVVALNWKWLFIYPEQGIATLNYLSIPEQTPIHLKLTADGAPMNSFWIPQLAGQIYSMAGMSTQLHLMANGPGEFVGREVEINGEGYSDMNFVVKSTSSEDFTKWVDEIKKSSLHLTQEAYDQLVKPSVNKSVLLFSEVEKDLYQKIVHKYMYPTEPVL